MGLMAFVSPTGVEVRHHLEIGVREREPCPRARSFLRLSVGKHPSWPVARWRVLGVNRDLSLAVVAVYLCHQTQPPSIPQTLHPCKSSLCGSFGTQVSLGQIIFEILRHQECASQNTRKSFFALCHHAITAVGAEITVSVSVPAGTHMVVLFQVPR